MSKVSSVSKVSTAVSLYMASIGRKGGRKSRRKLSSEQARSMSDKRWLNYLKRNVDGMGAEERLKLLFPKEGVIINEK